VTKTLPCPYHPRRGLPVGEGETVPPKRRLNRGEGEYDTIAGYGLVRVGHHYDANAVITAPKTTPSKANKEVPSQR